MYISKSFIPILKNNPSEAKIKSHQLMLRVGMIKQSSAGIYSWLPLGFKVMKKIEQIVREVVTTTMEMKCFVLKTDKVERCFMAQLTKS